LQEEAVQRKRTGSLAMAGLAVAGAGVFAAVVDAGTAEMQGDGNLVLYNDARQPAWAVGVFGTFTNLVIYHNGRTPIWASGTART
jgi:hypothetical protein